MANGRRHGGDQFSIAANSRATQPLPV